MKINHIYDKGYHTVRHKHLLVDDTYFWARAEASARLYFSDDERQKRIFEYGCGIGQGIAKLPNAFGWDISLEAREACRKRNIPVYDSISDVPKKSWDIVFCRHALEHMTDPLEQLNSMRELIAEGGEIYLVLPKEGHYYCTMEPDINQHLYCWNFRSINNLLYWAGYKPYHNSYTYVLGYRALLPLRRIFGKVAYYHAANLVGKIKNNGELIVRAKPA
jgi:SAM-dependent methyltransferase